MFAKILAKRKAQREEQARKDFIAEVGIEITDEAAAIKAFNEGRSATWYRNEMEFRKRQEERDLKFREAFNMQVSAESRLMASSADYYNALIEMKMEVLPPIYTIGEETFEDNEPEKNPGKEYAAAIAAISARQKLIETAQGMMAAELEKPEPDIIGLMNRIRNEYGEIAAKHPQYIQPDRVSDEEMAYLDNDDVLTERLLRDKAIIAMHLLRTNKAPNAKGVGANREDHPVFREVVNMWFTNEKLTSSQLEQVEVARARVTKYQRQLMGSPYWHQIIDTNVPRSEMMTLVNQAYAAKAEKELEEVLKEETYGGW